MNLWCRDSRLHFRNSRSLLFPGDSSRTFSFLSGEIIKIFLKANRLGFHFNASITPEKSILCLCVLKHYLCQAMVCQKESRNISINLLWSLIYSPIIIKLYKFNPSFPASYRWDHAWCYNNMAFIYIKNQYFFAHTLAIEIINPVMQKPQVKHLRLWR